VPNLVTYLNQTPIFEWCVARVGSKNGCPKDMSFEEIRLHAQNMMTILGSTMNIIGGTLYDYCNEHENLLFDNG
jgi:hypothetical protein